MSFSNIVQFWWYFPYSTAQNTFFHLCTHICFNMSKDGRGNFRSSCCCKRFAVSSNEDLVSICNAHTALYLPKLVKSQGQERQEQSRAWPPSNMLMSWYSEQQPTELQGTIAGPEGHWLDLIWKWGGEVIVSNMALAVAIHKVLIISGRSPWLS